MGKNPVIYYYDTEGRRDGKIRTKKHNLIIKPGLKDGLSKKFIQDRVGRDEDNCLQCGKESPTNDKSYYAFICKESKEKAEREDWKDYQDKEKKEEDIIVQYSNKILGIKPDYDMSYDENEEYNERVRKLIESKKIKSESEIRQENHDAVFDRMLIRHMPKPGMTDKEWRNAKRLAKEEER